MKDINHLLNELKLVNNNTMEYNKDFDLIKSVINYTNDYSKLINKIQYRGGNEGFILDITSRILRNLRNENYINDKKELNKKYENELRKITFFMVLNTEAVYPYDLQKDNTIACILNVMPQLPKCLLVNCLWGLGFDQFFNEIVMYTPHWLSLEFFSQINILLKHLDTYQGLLSAKQLINSIYMNIVRSDFMIMEPSERSRIYNKFIEIIYEILRQFFSPSFSEIDELDTAKQDDFANYLGYVMKYLSETILQSFYLYKNKPKFEIPDKYKIYNIMGEICCRVDNHSEIYSTEVGAALLKINEILLNSLKLNGMSVTLYFFMKWVEIDLDEDRTLQQDIGENVFQIIEILNIEQVSDKTLIPMLRNIAIKPKTLEEQIREANLGDMMKKIESLPDDDTVKTKWMNEFIKRGDLVISNAECLETLQQNIGSITTKSMKLLLKAFEEDDLEYEDKIKQIIIESFQQQNNEDDSLDILAHLIDNFGNDVDIFQNEEDHAFTQQLTELFNKIHIESSISYKKYKIFLLKNPKKFYDYIWENLLSSSDITDNNLLIFNEIFMKTKQIYESNYFEKNLEYIFNANLQNISNQFIELIFQFYTNNFLDKSYFVKDILLKFLLNALHSDTENLMKINLLIMILLKIFNDMDRDGTELEIVPILIIFGGIMEKFRWDLIEYNKQYEEILNKSIDTVKILQMNLLAKQKITGDKLLWIKSKLAAYKRINLYYFQNLLNSDNLDFCTFLQAQITTKDDNIGFLCENLVRCTYDEMEIIYKNAKFQVHFSDAILLISIIVKKSYSLTTSINCLQQIFLNYIKILNNSISHIIPDEDARMKIYEICNILVGLPESIYDSLFLYAHQILLELYQKIAANVVADDLDTGGANRLVKLKKKLEKMPNCEGKMILLNKI